MRRPLIRGGDLFCGFAGREEYHVVGKVFIVKTVFGKGAGTAAVGAYAVLACVKAEHSTAAGLEFIVMGPGSEFLLCVVGCVEGKRYMAVGCEHMGVVIKSDIITAAAASVFLRADVIFVEVSDRSSE